MRRDTDPAGPAGDDHAGPDAGACDELRAQLQELENRYLRLAADFENYRRRALQERLGAREEAMAAIAERLVPVLDDAERAMRHVPEKTDDAWLAGLRLTLQKLEEVLDSIGVEYTEAVGARFDPRLHEAIGSEQSSEHPEGTVVRELRRGYRLGDKVLRPSLVKVAGPPDEE